MSLTTMNHREAECNLWSVGDAYIHWLHAVLSWKRVTTSVLSA